MFGPGSGNPVLARCGYVLMIDEVSLDERPRYDTTHDSVLGICREHGSQYDLSVTLENLLELQLGLRDGTIHRAKEATVVSLAPFSETHYNPTPIIISGTCKTERDVQQAKWINRSLEAWESNPHGQAVRGLIWSIATDGDAVQRKAVHHVAMAYRLEPSSPIYPLLEPLALMNLQCGPNSITVDIDYKHLYKR